MSRQVQSPSPRGERRVGLAISAVVLVVLAWLWMRSPSTHEVGGGHRDTLASEGVLGSFDLWPDGGRSRRRRDAGGLGDAGIDPARLAETGERPPLVETPIPGFVPEPGEVDPGPGRDYVEHYQGRSGALSPNLRPGQGDVTTRVRSPGLAPRLITWVPTIRIQAGAPVVIYAQLVDDQERPVRGAEVVIAVGRPGREPEIQQAMPPARPGQSHQYELSFPAPVERPADADPNAPVTYDYRIQAVGTLNGEQYSRVVTGGFGVHSPPGSIDRTTLRVERDGSDIAVRFRVTVDRAAAFWGYAELWGGAEATTAIAFAADRFPAMTPGPHDVTLRFGGRIIRDLGIDGPYVVRNVKWMQVDAIPPQETEPILELPPTPAWSAHDFQ